jgi:hypothetical protein
MMKTKHTPGPWTLPKFSGADKSIEIPEPQVLIDYDDVDHKEQAANAQLIAAAPETAAERDQLKEVNAKLVEALKTFIQAEEEYRETNSDTEFDDPLSDAYDEARAALAAAKECK